MDLQGIIAVAVIQDTLFGALNFQDIISLAKVSATMEIEIIYSPWLRHWVLSKTRCLLEYVLQDQISKLLTIRNGNTTGERKLDSALFNFQDGEGTVRVFDDSLLHQIGKYYTILGYIHGDIETAHIRFRFDYTRFNELYDEESIYVLARRIHEGEMYPDPYLHKEKWFVGLPCPACGSLYWYGHNRLLGIEHGKCTRFPERCRARTGE